MKSSQLYLIILAVAIVVVIGLFAAFRTSPGSVSQQPPGTSPPSPQAPEVKPQAVYAQEGQLIQGFPQELILDANSDLGKSYSVNYSSNFNQYTAIFNSNHTMSDIFSSYKAYFAASDWTIVNQVTRYAGVRGLYARQAHAEASVAIIDQKKVRQVTVSYVKK